MIRFNKYNDYEFEKDWYLINNTMLDTETFPAFAFNIVSSGATVDVYYIDKTSIERGDEYLNQYLIFTRTLSLTDNQVYYSGEDSDHEGIFRYVIRSGGDSYWGEPFCKKIRSVNAEYRKLNSGLIKFYTGDLLEFVNDWYYSNNTTLKNIEKILSYYFDIEDTINSISLSLYKVNKFRLDEGTIEDYKVKDLSALNENTVIYEEQSTYLGTGLHRIRGEVDTAGDPAVPVYSEIFYIKESTCFWVFKGGLWDDRGCWDDSKIMSF